MKKYIGIFVALVLAFLIIYKIKPGSSTLDKSVTDFSIQDTSSITAMRITGNDGEAVYLKKSGKLWILNDSLKPRPDMLYNLKNALYKLEVLYPVPKNFRKKVMTDMNTSSKKIEIWEGEGRLVKTIFLSGITNDREGSYAYIKGAKDPYVIGMKALEGHVDAQFVSSVKAWRSHLAFTIKSEEIEMAAISYPHQPENSFLLLKNKSGLQLSQDGKEIIENTDINVLEATSFLQSFNFLNAEAYQNEYIRRDSVVRSLPFAIIEIKAADGRRQQAKIFYMPVYERTKVVMDPRGKPLPYDSDRYFALINEGKDFVILQQYVFGDILKQYSDFLRKN